MGREWVWSLLIRALIPFMRAPPILHHELITSQSPHHQILSHSELDVNIWIFQGHKHSVQKTSNKFRSSLISGIVMKYISIFQLQDLSEIQLFYLISFQKYKYFIWFHLTDLKNSNDLTVFAKSHVVLGEGNGTLLQNSCLGNLMDGGAW